MQLREFQRIVDTLFKPNAAMRGDNIGLHVSSRRDTARKVLVCLEVTDAVLAEAITLDCDAILAFHPLIYTPLLRLDRNDRIGRLACSLIENDIALLCVHTAFDAFPAGTNHVLANRLGLHPLRPLQPSPVGEGFGMGLLASAPDGMTFDMLMERTTAVCGSPVRYIPPTTDIVTSVALVGGSGASFMDDAIASGADVFITADVKYHGFHAADGVIGLIDPGHFEMERFVPAGMIQALGLEYGMATELVESRVITNPVRYAAPAAALPYVHSSLS